MRVPPRVEAKDSVNDQHLNLFPQPPQLGNRIEIEMNALDRP